MGGGRRPRRPAGVAFRGGEGARLLPPQSLAAWLSLGLPGRPRHTRPTRRRAFAARGRTSRLSAASRPAGSLTALVCQHSITPLALPCKLLIPDRGTRPGFGLAVTVVCQPSSHAGCGRGARPVLPSVPGCGGGVRARTPAHVSPRRAHRQDKGRLRCAGHAGVGVCEGPARDITPRVFRPVLVGKPCDLSGDPRGRDSRGGAHVPATLSRGFAAETLSLKNAQCPEHGAFGHPRECTFSRTSSESPLRLHGRLQRSVIKNENK